MNSHIYKKSMCLMLCGALLVSAVPAQAFSFSSIVANLKTFVGWHSDGSSNNTVIAAASAVAIAAVAGIGYWLYKKNKTPSVPSGSFIPKADPFKIVCEQIEANDFTSAAQGINSGTFDINKKDIKGKTVLMLLFDSVTHGTREEMDLRVCHVVEVILKKKPDLSLVDYNGENVFHKAALREFCMCFGRLYLSLPKGNIDSYVLAKNWQDKTPLDLFSSSVTRDRMVAEIRANGYTLNFEPQKDHDEIKRPISLEEITDEIKRNMSDEPVNSINPLANSMSSLPSDPLWDYIADETNATPSKTPSATTAMPNFIDSLPGVTSTPANTAAPTASDATPQIPSASIQITDNIVSPPTAERNGTEPSLPQSNDHISIAINPHESPLNHNVGISSSSHSTAPAPVVLEKTLKAPVKKKQRRLKNSVNHSSGTPSAFPVIFENHFPTPLPGGAPHVKMQDVETSHSNISSEVQPDTVYDFTAPKKVKKDDDFVVVDSKKLVFEHILDGYLKFSHKNEKVRYLITLISRDNLVLPDGTKINKFSALDQDEEGTTFLMHAAQKGDVNLVQFLVNYRFSLKDKKIVATQKEDREAFVTIHDTTGRSAQDYAAEAFAKNSGSKAYNDVKEFLVGITG